MSDKGQSLPSAMFAMIRLSLYTASVFALLGVILPYWPLWLASRGLGAQEIGLVLAAGILTRVALTPAIAAWADRSGERKRIILALAAISLLGGACYLPADGFWPILIVSSLVSGCLNGMVVLGDAVTLTAAERDGFAYSRVRLWGSAAFLAVAALTGWAARGQEADMLLWTMLGILTLAVLCALALPDSRSARREGRFFDIMPLLRSRQLMGMFLIAGLIQNSHHFYYGFSTLHWRMAGLDETLIGGLWAEGVLAEILLFWLAPRLGLFRSPAALLLIGGAGGALRWAVMACTADPAILAAIQLLHAASFAAAHLGAMQLLISKAPNSLHTLAQGLYSALPMGLGGAAVTFASGLCYGRWGGDAFWIASAMCAVGAIGTFFMCSFVARLPPAPNRK